MAKNNKRPSAFDRIIANSHAISVMLQENEELFEQLDSDGVDAPERKNLIRFPVGRVATLKEYNERYHLPEIIKRDITVRNAGYCLQACEIYKYMIERFGFYGPVPGLIYMCYFIFQVSVVEALIDSSAKHLGISGGDFRKTMAQNNQEYPKIVGLSSDSVGRIHELYNRRNSIHLERTKVEDIVKLEFTETDITNAEKALDELAELLYKNAVPRYIK